MPLLYNLTLANTFLGDGGCGLGHTGGTLGLFLALYLNGGQSTIQCWRPNQGWPIYKANALTLKFSLWANHYFK